MPSFELMDKVELFLRTGTFHVDASQSSKKVTKATSKHFIYKDDCLWRSYRGRLLRVVRSDEEVREILTRYHDDNNHRGRVWMIKEIMLMYYWVGVTEVVKSWIKDCAVCQSQSPAKPPTTPVRFCLAYGCDASSYIYPELGFHRFPKEAELRRRWLALAQRDEGSLRTNSCLCSRHFEPSCFTPTEDNQLTLLPEAVPSIIHVTVQEDQVPVPSDEDFLHSQTLEDLLSTAAAETTEHQYCIPTPDLDSRAIQTVTEFKRRKTLIEPSFAVYNQIARYLSHRVFTIQGKQARSSLRRMAKRFGLIDGVLMYTRVSPPLRVPRSREEVKSILKQVHDNQGHRGQGICQREITKRFYWASMTRDLSHWISSCDTCLSRTKRKWLRCSIFNCTNFCGPVERGLGLTFHKFPLHNAAVLAQWLKAVGRPHWHPRPWSSICSTHFAEDCFDRSGQEVTLHPDAVPTLLDHSGSATSSRGQAQSAVREEAYFAKFDAAALYLSRRVYPPGLSYVEKNTFRRFCKSFTIKDDKLHMVRGDRMRLVLRSRQQVEAALMDFHNELNHLDVNKCLRLLNERYFWKTMKPDVMQWINSCSQCSSKKRKKIETEPGGSDSRLGALRSPQIHDDLDSGQDDDDDDDGDRSDEEDNCGDVDEGDGSVGDEARQPARSSEVRLENPVASQPITPILLHVRTPINSQPQTPIILQLRTSNTPFVTRLCQSEVQKETNSCVIRPVNQSSVQAQVEPQVEEQMRPQDRIKSSGSSGIAKPRTEPQPPPDLPKHPQATSSQIQPASQSKGLMTRLQRRNHGGVLRPQKRKADLETGSPAKRSSICGLEPVVTPSTKPWPVFTIAGSVSAQTARPPTEVDSPAPFRRPRSLQARIVIQQCSEAKVKTKPGLDGADAQWAEIQEGMVVYVSFFHGATEEVTDEMANRLMTTRFFRKDARHLVSVVDLPGSVLLIPQDSLRGQLAPNRRIQYNGGCELWWGAQLFSKLVSACREFMSGSVKCIKAGVKVEQGVYGPKQEIVLSSPEPLTLLQEF